MILVDTSIWIDHIRKPNPVLQHYLNEGEVYGHPLVIGELAAGSLPNRQSFIATLEDLPEAVVATHAETMHFIEKARLFSRGIGYMDISLLAAARLTSGTKLWTRDNRLRAVADELGLCAVPEH